MYEYALVDTTGRHDLAELRAFQDWTLRYWLQSVDGVAEVASVGGFVRAVPGRCSTRRGSRRYGVTARQVADAIRTTRATTSGGGVLEIAEHEVIVRGRGYVTTLADLASVPVKVGGRRARDGARQLGDVRMGPEPRRGIAELDGRGEVVGGIVVMRQGENALP